MRSYTLSERWDFLADVAEVWKDARAALGSTLRMASRVVDRLKSEMERWLSVVDLADDGAITVFGATATDRMTIAADGTVTIPGLLRPGNVAYTTASFGKTDTTLTNVTGLSKSLAVGTWSFRAELPVTADAVGGHKYAMAGTATASAVWYEVFSINNGAPGLPVITSRQTALGGGGVGQAGSTSAHTAICGTVTVSVAGTLTVQFAQNAANGTSSVIAGASLMVW